MRQLCLCVVGTNVPAEGQTLLEQLKPKVKRKIPLLEVNVMDEDSLSRTISKYDLCIRFVLGGPEEVTMTTEMSSVLFLAMMTVITMVILIQTELDYPSRVMDLSVHTLS